MTPTLFDLTGRGELVLTGKDRAALLHGLVTNDIKALKPGAGCHAALLTPKGKMQADLVVLCHDDRLVLDCESALAEKLARMIPTFVFFQEAILEDRTAATAVLHLSGGGASGTLEALGLAVPAEVPHAHVTSTREGGAVTVVSERRTGGSGFDLRLPRTEAVALAQALLEGGARQGDGDELERARIEAGIPRWGAELDESVLPNEARLERDAISYTKGCYIGQEIVARIRTYGHVNRLLVKLALSGEVAAGAEVRAGEAAVGRVTSATGAGEGFVALAYVRREHATGGTAVTVAGPQGTVEGRVLELPLA